MHLKAKRAAFGGLLLAMTVIFMFLGSVIETNTLFLLAAASFFVGVVFREFGQMTGLAFYLSAVLLGFLLAPNKLYVITFAGMGFYIWGREFIWKILERSAGVKRKMQWYRLAKVILFNGLYLPLILGYGELFFGGEISEWLRYSSVLAGQVIFALYDKAYDYGQLHIWGKISNRLFSEYKRAKRKSHISVTQGEKVYEKVFFVKNTYSIEIICENCVRIV